MLVWLVILFLFSGLLMVFIPGVGAAPVISNENPSSGSVNQPLSLVWNTTITNVSSWSIECSNGQSQSTSGLVYDYIYDGYYVKALTSGSGTWTVPTIVTSIDVLVVAGGGGSGTGTTTTTRNAGGGGAGGLVWVRNVTVTPLSSVSYAVGAGGASPSTNNYPGGTGGDSTFSNLTAKGGGGGGSFSNPNGVSGGSGGGGCGRDAFPGSGGISIQDTVGGSSSIYGHGNDGEDGTGAGVAGGGGGAGSAGSGTSGGTGMNMSAYFGTSYGNSGWFASGGGAHDVGVDAVANSGMGGRARATDSASAGRAGGSGIILIRQMVNPYISLTGLSYDTNYTIWVNSTNGTAWTNNTFYFRTQIQPPTNITSSFNSTSQNLTLSWSKTTSASHTLIRKSLTGYPTTITNGTLVGNVTGTTAVDASIDAAYYYSFWTFNATYSYYSSTYSTLSWDDLNIYSINVYDEETEAAITNWSVLISNKDGTDTYYSSGNNNTLFLNVSDIPTGEDISFMFSATGYNTRTYTTDVTGIVNFNIYLIAESPPGAGDCSLLTFYDTRTVSNHSVVCTVNLTHTSESLISVEIYNTTLFSTYGGWIVVSSDYYTESVSQVVVSASILDANSSMVRVSYYYEYCVGDVSSLLYMVNVVDETSRPIKDAYISVTRYMSGTSSFEEIASLYTDGNGQATLYLAPDVLYKFNISKTNYVTEVADWIPSEDVRSKTFTISPEPPDYTDEINIGDCFTFSGETSSTTAFVNFTCSCDTLYNFSIWIYEIEHDSGNISYFSSYNYTGDTSAAISFVMNLSCNYHISFYLNHSVFGGFWSSFYITNYEPLTNRSEFDDLFTNIFGTNSLTWSGLFGIFVLLAGLFAFGQRGAGISLVMVGFVMLGFNVVFGLLLLNVTICILIVLFGVLVQWKIERGMRG